MRLGDIDGEEDGGDEGAEHGAGQEIGHVGQERRRPELRGQTLPDPLSGECHRINKYLGSQSIKHDHLISF